MSRPANSIAPSRLCFSADRHHPVDFAARRSIRSAPRFAVRQHLRATPLSAGNMAVIGVHAAHVRSRRGSIPTSASPRGTLVLGRRDRRAITSDVCATLIARAV